MDMALRASLIVNLVFEARRSWDWSSCCLAVRKSEHKNHEGEESSFLMEC